MEFCLIDFSLMTWSLLMTEESPNKEGKMEILFGAQAFDLAGDTAIKSEKR